MLYIEGEIERDKRDELVRVINKDLEKSKVLNVDAVERAGELLEDFPELWSETNTQERNGLLKTVLDAVYVDLERREIVSIQPNQAFAGPLRAMAERSDLALVEGPEPPLSRELSHPG